MFFPENFPPNLTEDLKNFLLLAQEKWQKNKSPKNIKTVFRAVLKENKFLFKNIPPIWWLRFILLRWEKNFSPEFIKATKSLIKTKVRSYSGILPVAVFTKPVGCPFHCLYCPETKTLPKSYLKDEPALMRALRENFDPYSQTRNRLISLALSGHNANKVEIIIKGGTFSFYSQKYRQKFVKEVFDAANSDILKIIKTGKENFSKSKSLIEAQKLNEKAKTRIVGINIETRPDFITPQEIEFLRKLGVTHVELGVQILDDDILKKINRQQMVSQVIQATFLLKESGFKITYHLMPNLPFSSPEKDLKTFKKVFTSSFSPDHLKIYPTVIPKESKLKKLIENKVYRPYSLKKLISLLVKVKTEIIPPWVRISRLARDVSEKSILAPKIPSNLREIVLGEIKKLGKKCQCIRCREIKDKPWKGTPKLRIFNYSASEGKEYFLEFIDNNHHCLGFLRLRIPAYILNPKIKPLFSVLKDAALIRELHIYGPATPLAQKDLLFTQHRNLGKKLIAKAEKITKKLKIKKIAVISGVGVREYYRKLGYKLQQTYMVKNLK